MDDMWGDDLPDDIVEECVLLASQATSAAVASPKSKESGSSFSMVLATNYIKEFRPF